MKLKVGKEPLGASIFNATTPNWAGLESRHPVRQWGRVEMDIHDQAPAREEFPPYPIGRKNTAPEPDTTQYMHKTQKRLF